MNACRFTLPLVGLLLTCTPAFTEVPSDTEIRKILAERVGAADNGAGIVVGVAGATSGRHLLNASYPLQKVEAPTERKQITLDTKAFDRYVGQCELGPNAIMTMSRDGDRFYTQLTGQPKFEVFAGSERKLFLKVVDAQLTIDVDAQGTATQVTLHQDGRDIVAKRMNDPDIKRAVDESAAIAKRFKDQTQSRETEAALRRDIEELQRGEPNYDQTSPQLADITRQRLPQLKAAMEQLGTLQSVTFTGVGPGGAHIYQVKFEHGATE